MPFVVYTDTDDPFIFQGKIGATEGNIVFKDSSGVRIYKTEQIVAIMRQDFADEYHQAIQELNDLKHGRAEDN